MPTPFVDQRWLGGMLTNFKTIKQSIKRPRTWRRWLRMVPSKAGQEGSADDPARTGKLEKSIGGIKEMGALPDALFVIDVGYHKIAITRSQQAWHPGDRRC